MKPFFHIILFALILPTLGVDVEAEQLLANARYVSALNKQDLTGKLKKGSNEVPIKLYMRGKDIQMQYELQKDVWNGVHLELKDSNCELFDIIGGEMKKFPDQKIGQPIASTDLSYEDLSLRFLYWPAPEIVGEESVKTQDCYIVRVFNPDTRGNYAVCDLWIHKKAAALMKVKAFNAKGQHIKTFEASDLMNVDGEILMRKMKVERLSNGRVDSVSYLIFDNPEGVLKKRKAGRKLK